MKKITFFEVVDYITAFVLVPIVSGGAVSWFIWVITPLVSSVTIRPAGVVMVWLLTAIYVGIKMPKVLHVIYGKGKCVGELLFVLVGACFFVVSIALLSGGVGTEKAMAIVTATFGFCFLSLGWRLEAQEAFREE